MKTPKKNTHAHKTAGDIDRRCDRAGGKGNGRELERINKAINEKRK